VVGGGDAAVKGAVLLSKYADKVYIIYRGERFTRPQPEILRQMHERPNIQPIFSANVVELKGTDGLDGIVLDRPYDTSRELAVSGLFVEIGADPRVELANQLGVELNELDEIRVDRSGRTNVLGVFAAGDVTDASGALKQTITAAAQGALAATAAYEHISVHGNMCRIHAVAYSLG
jgi:thioredoxin reductase (NADPH)